MNVCWELVVKGGKMCRHSGTSISAASRLALGLGLGSVIGE